MMKTIIIITIIIIAVILEIKYQKELKKRLSKYWDKSDYLLAKKWRKRFPRSSNEEIRTFLECFVDGFAFDSKKRLKFEPDDKVMGIYGTLYPPKKFFASDALELETFAMNLEHGYKIKFSDVWQEDITLGEIFCKLTNYETNKALN